ncbi:hypothetical protein BACCAP_00932 [Pseudoflavonifractor capillosus ATCC 29799]|uniref:Uncharacterized protein n=1 Tax=Pseudoflavonifractor capillosus ATCC 29799 TaxID=411467 RepID=A6NRV4_9FIRM|nr:hypothetical protein BACCAP_00932 [Pseudoflavonifractor capillosus ATCC 29799]
MHNTYCNTSLILASFHKKSSGKYSHFLPHRSGTIKNELKTMRFLCKNYINTK